MENKKVGWIIIGISIVLIFIIFLFNNTMRELIYNTCDMIRTGQYCPMTDSINNQTYISLGIVGFLIIVGLVLMFSKPDEKIIIRKMKDSKSLVMNVSHLNIEEKKVLVLIQKNKAIFQADLIEKTGFGKAKMTRIIDRLEGQGMVERKRRGMTNIVVLKN